MTARDQQSASTQSPEATSDTKENDNTLTTADLVAGTRQADNAATEQSEQTATARPANEARGSETATATPLFPGDKGAELRTRWDDIQAGFVDDPQRTIQQADTLVAEAMTLLAQTFADERARLEQHWQGGSEVSTEDLRVAVQRYRSFFQRLLAV